MRAFFDALAKGFLYRHLLKASVVTALMLILYGFFSGVALAVILVLFSLLRLTSLATEAMHSQETRPDLSTANPNSWVPRRRTELSAEALGVIAFALLIPLTVALYARDFFSFRSPQGWEGAALAVLCIAAYAYPHRFLKAPDSARVRIFWWAIPFAVVIPLLNHAVETRHPYLNPFRSDRTQLAAERVLALRHTVIAGRHSDWVMRYARQLDAEGRIQEAVHFYREALRLDSNDGGAQKRLAVLEARLPDAMQILAKPEAQTNATNLEGAMQPLSLPRRSINRELEKIDGCTVMLVPVGEVSIELLDRVGHTIQGELGLPVCISTDNVPLPPRTRVRGLATGPQWEEARLVQAFTNTFKAFPNAPIKYVLITPGDIYMSDAHFVFSTTYAWGALISSARFAERGESDLVVWQRTGKQAICALIKSFGVPVSTDRMCVTSYARTLEEFDAKGNRPSSETERIFRQAVSDLNSQWRQHLFQTLSRQP